jgi:valyl-tRNA synthetase
MATIAPTVRHSSYFAYHRPGDQTASIMVAPYPVYEKEFDDPVAAVQYEQVIAVVKASRSLLEAYGIKQDAKGSSFPFQSKFQSKFKLREKL